MPPSDIAAGANRQPGPNEACNESMMDTIVFVVMGVHVLM